MAGVWSTPDEGRRVRRRGAQNYTRRPGGSRLTGAAAQIWLQMTFNIKDPTAWNLTQVTAADALPKDRAPLELEPASDSKVRCTG